MSEMAVSEHAQLSGPQIVELAYVYADALKAAECAAERLWRHLPAERRGSFTAAEDLDTFAAEKAIRAAADAWQDELDADGE